MIYKFTCFQAFSAGTRKSSLNPYAVKVMSEIKIDITNQFSKTIAELEEQDFKYVFTLCSDAEENCPVFLQGKTIHIAFDDPPKLAENIEDEIQMVGETTGLKREEPQAILSADDIIALQNLTREVPSPENVVSYAVRLASASRPQSDHCDEWTKKRVKWGAGSRGAQALILAGKARALLSGRSNVSCEDVKIMAKSGLRHRVLPSFFAESEGLDSDDIIDHLLEVVAQ